MIIDAQVHCYEVNSPQRPWVGTIAGPEAVTGHNQVAAMDAVGVDGAIMVSTWSTYGFDPSYAQEVHTEYPTRFALVTPIDPYDVSAADRVTAWAGAPGAVGIRILAAVTEGFRADDQPVARTIQAAMHSGLPICLNCAGKEAMAEELARLHPDAQFVIDSLGLQQPMKPPKPKEPFARLDSVLALAKYPNIAIKVVGACTLSLQPYPFEDIWTPLARVFDSFGIARCLWGTDWTRAVDFVNYADAVRVFRDRASLSADERAQLMGGTVQRIFGWPANEPGSR